MKRIAKTLVMASGLRPAQSNAAVITHAKRCKSRPDPGERVASPAPEVIRRRPTLRAS